MSRRATDVLQFHVNPLCGAGSLLLAQVNVEHSAYQEERDAQPRQDEAVAKASFGQISAVV